MESFDDQEEQALNLSHGCQTGACFTCCLGAGNNNALEWQSSYPNPLPQFPRPYEFYTPILLPGKYLPIDIFADKELGDGILFQKIQDAELARKIVSYLFHESIHSNLLVGLVPLVMRLIGSRCYALLALLLKDGFRQDIWQVFQSQNIIIKSLFTAIGPIHEIVANMHNIFGSNNDPYKESFSQLSIVHYSKAYGEVFTQIYNDFNSITKNLQDWFAPNPIQPTTMIMLSEFILLHAIDARQILDDFISPPSVIPKEHLYNRFAHSGVPYIDPFVNMDRQHGKQANLQCYTYDVFDTTEILQKVASAIKNTKPKRSNNPLENDISQVLYIAEAIPEFHEFLQKNGYSVLVKTSNFE